MYQHFFKKFIVGTLINQNGVILFSTMQLLYTYLKKHVAFVLLALLLAAINQIFSLLDPFIFRFIIDNYVSEYKSMPQDVFILGVTKLLGAAIGVAFVSRLAKNFQDYTVNVITQKVGAAIYADGLGHALSLPFRVFEDQRSGETLGILQKARTDVERLINAFINILFTTLVGIIFVLIYAFTVHWLIAPIYLITIPLLGIVSNSLSKKVKKVQKSIVTETTALAGSTTESLRNIELVKSLGLAKQEVNRLNLTTLKILALELKKVRYVRSLSFLQGTLVNLLRTLILFIMVYLIYKEEITVGQFFSLFIYSFFIFGPLQELGNIINLYRETEVSLENLTAVFNQKPEPKPLKPQQAIPLHFIRFEKVSFKHREDGPFALQDIELELKKGETIAFVGPSGSGKTTLIKLLVGLYRAQDGQILYNNIKQDALDFENFRENIGLVSQDTQLFSGTILENLRFVKPDATENECLEVLQMASCMHLINRNPLGLLTPLGENGIKVSGGEKQRLAIARALLRNPEMLIFDEATSALDSLTEVDITDTIKNLKGNQNRINVIIAHRLSTILHADKIMVLEKGMLVEQGNHLSLLAEKGLYYAMWRQQAGERKPL